MHDLYLYQLKSVQDVLLQENNQYIIARLLIFITPLCPGLISNKLQAGFFNIKDF